MTFLKILDDSKDWMSRHIMVECLFCEPQESAELSKWGYSLSSDIPAIFLKVGAQTCTSGPFSLGI